MRICFWSLVFLLVFPFFLYPEIVELDRLVDVLAYCDTQENKQENLLVIWDIDNTLASSPIEVGTDQSFVYLYKKEMNKTGSSIEEAVDIVLPEYWKIQERVELETSEENTLDILKKIKANAPSIALTARSPQIKDLTLGQLQKAGFGEFSSLLPHQEVIQLDFLAGYKKGIIFCGNNDKGKTLFYMLDKASYFPTKIIFIDDKVKNLKVVEKACLEQGIEFIGLRYNAYDERVKNFSPERYEQQVKDLFPEGIDVSSYV